MGLDRKNCILYYINYGRKLYKGGTINGGCQVKRPYPTKAKAEDIYARY
jgi:hypothetical protein